MATVYEIMNQLSNIRCEMREQIALLTLNRPEALNALNSKTLEELDLIFESLENTEDILGVIITGEGRAFAAGADIVQMKDYKCEDARNYAGYAQKVFNRIEALEKPVVKKQLELLRLRRNCPAFAQGAKVQIESCGPELTIEWSCSGHVARLQANLQKLTYRVEIE